MKKQEPKPKGPKRMTLEDMLADFNALRFGVLATSDKGKPYTSLIAFALTPDRHTLVFATSRATSKYRNICGQPAVSILLDDRSQNADDLHRARAVTLIGTAKEVSAAAQRKEYRLMYVNRHPELASFIDEPDTALVAVTVRQALHVARFQDVSRWP